MEEAHTRKQHMYGVCVLYLLHYEQDIISSNEIHKMKYCKESY